MCTSATPAMYLKGRFPRNIEEAQQASCTNQLKLSIVTNVAPESIASKVSIAVDQSATTTCVQSVLNRGQRLVLLSTAHRTMF